MSDSATVNNVYFSTEPINSGLGYMSALSTVIHRMHTAYYYDGFLLIT